MRNSVLLILLVLGAAMTGCGKREAAIAVRASESTAVTARVLTVAPESFLATVRVTGTLVSRSRVEVKAEVIGRITRFDKEEGAHVEAGEAVAWVDDENYQLSVKQAETAVKVAEAGLERALLVESHSGSELERARNLLKSGGITDKDLKAAQLAERDSAGRLFVRRRRAIEWALIGARFDVLRRIGAPGSISHDGRQPRTDFGVCSLS